MRKSSVTLAFLLTAAAWQGAAEEEITPAHVYQAVSQVSANIGLIREVMGRPELTTDPWVVIDAQPRHVYYQALTLFRKANSLATELAGAERQTPPPVLGEEIAPADVFAVVALARGHIDTVRRELGMTYGAELAALEPDRQPRDVFRETIQASRQLNFLLDRQFKPEDVYGRLELAATYVAGALTEDESEPIYGVLPPFEAGKVPADVYRRVLECLELATVIGEKRDIDMLRLNLRRELRRRDIAPADVYDLATTLLSELAYLTLVLDAKDVPAPEIDRPKHVFPSHVFRIAGMLQDELARLEADL